MYIMRYPDALHFVSRFRGNGTAEGCGVRVCKCGSLDIVIEINLRWV